MTIKPVVRLIDPTPCLCPGQRPPRFPAAGSKFIRQVSASAQNPYYSCSIDGYIVNSDGLVTRLFFKREFEVISELNSYEELSEQLLLSTDFLSAKPAIMSVARQLGCGVDYLFSPQGYPYNRSGIDRMVMISVDDLDTGKARRRTIGPQNLAEHIRKYRGRSFSSPKPITVATSHIECYLANDLRRQGSADPFPGDLDLIILRESRARCVVEFKTHNLKTNIASESCLKYQERDWRRLNVLTNVCSQLDSRLFYVFWGDIHNNIKIEEVSLDKKILKSELIEKNPDTLFRYISSHT